ncbi:hypothetical protein QR680_012308 [Steinernema hermaphroditum]|uniref:Uncharacterized protein n=1 Tax=Steinernema hermaphroditum TaxID=289476 RepID=A0AA39M0J2_9BILA|nr:hypothetical protein QR680_012308 [Steinernema hermaphroditum]
MKVRLNNMGVQVGVFQDDHIVFSTGLYHAVRTICSSGKSFAKTTSKADTHLPLLFHRTRPLSEKYLSSRGR